MGDVNCHSIKKGKNQAGVKFYKKLFKISMLDYF